MNEYKKVASYEAQEGTFDKVLLLYSGGLDTSVMLKWIQDKYNAEVYALCINIGQREDFEPIKQKALNLGAKVCEVVDATERYAQQLCEEAILFNADYEDGYHLFCPLGRIMISAIAAEYATKWGINVVCHGATGKGNDQIRFDNYITTLNPNIKILAPVREWSMGREEEIAYAKEHNIPVTASLEKIYSYDENLWGCSAEGGAIEDFKKVPPLNDILKFTNLPESSVTPDTPEYVRIAFNQGSPVGIKSEFKDHEAGEDIGSMLHTIKYANHVGKIHGIGITHLVEDRVLGLKVRGIYEEPGAEILIKAHKALEKAVCTREEILFKEKVDRQWSQLVYEGRYLHPLRESLAAFCLQMNSKVTGTVTVKLFKGRAEVVAIDSKNCLNNEAASFVTDGGFNQGASAGFIEHFGYTQKLCFNLNNK
jgi:argininosuccinate synthase